ncbi:NAD-dependent epimerase/dehydratase family protein [Cryptosporangium minutisporangium]|uniref:NAD-dependent epimerase/dehydratase family protein n=1 Tax=Cryptosporangium minutisporangium TaxID=113569 RepID=A0ABP6T806_9ACTN
MPAEETPPGLPRVVLVTGVSRYFGGRLAARLAADPGIERILGVDTVAPDAETAERIGRTEFVRADIRNPLIAKVIADAGVDTVVHMSVLATPAGLGGRASMKELNVIGTMQLLAACQKAPTVRKLVVRSSTAVYGASPRDPAVFTENIQAKQSPPSGYAKDATEVEGYVRGFTRRRPDVIVTTLRLANMLSPRIDTPLARYFALPVVPTVLGYDARLQFLHVEDGLDALCRAVLEDHPGTYNVAGPGSLLLSQAIRRAGRVPVPVPSITAPYLGLVVRQAGSIDFSPEQTRLLTYGRVVDISRLQQEFGLTPAYTTAAAFDDFVRGSDLASVLSAENLSAVERALKSRWSVARRLVESVRAGAPRP